jgi:membrane fusion protein (multidrug efflux system)
MEGLGPDVLERPRDAAQSRSSIEGSPNRGNGRRNTALLIVVLAVTAMIGAGVLYWLKTRDIATTDDAFVDGHITQMAPQIAGRVLHILVDDNQHVSAGQVLLQIDLRDYQVKLDQARAQRANAQAGLAQALAQLELQLANLDQAQANVAMAEAELLQAQQDYDRYRSVNPQAVTRQQIDSATATLHSKTAHLEANRQLVRAGQAQIEAIRAQIAAAEAAIKQSDADVANAELQLSYTTITAPSAGRFTKRTVEVGNYVTPGTAMFALVQDQVWVTANFKETQLTRMRPGQRVEIDVDAYPDITFRGHVDSFQSGTGSAFSSLPAENATGNYVKVVQRVPVKIVFDDDRAANYSLVPGMSVEPFVRLK